MYDAFLKHTAEQTTAWQKMEKDSRDKCEQTLKQEQGQAYGQFEGAAKAALGEYADPEFFAFLDSKGLGNDPRMIRVFGRIGQELLGDDKLKGAGGTGAPTTAEMQVKLAEFRKTNHDILFNKPEHPDHKRMVAELEQLHRAAAGGK